jgi:hypothetical protein
MKRWFEAFLVALFLLFTGPALAQSQPPSKPEVPAVNAGVGACSADFLVRDASGAPLYNAQVGLTVHYGFLGLRKTEVQVGTNGDGRARVTGLPAKTKKPLAFTVRYKHWVKPVADEPAANCHARFDVRLGE